MLTPGDATALTVQLCGGTSCANNQLTGALPIFGGSIQITDLDFSNNSFTGTVPSAFAVQVSARRLELPRRCAMLQGLYTLNTNPISESCPALQAQLSSFLIPFNNLRYGFSRFRK